MESLGTLSCVLDVQFSGLQESKRKKGVRVLGYEIEMVPSGASLEFSLYIDGRKQGAKSVRMAYG